MSDKAIARKLDQMIRDNGDDPEALADELLEWLEDRDDDDQEAMALAVAVKLLSDSDSEDDDNGGSDG